MIHIFDNFSDNIDRVRQSALNSGFGTWAPNKGEVGSSIYTGMNYTCEHSLMIHALIAHLGKPVIPNSMFCRVTNSDTEKAYVHSDRDAGSHTCIVYLSEHGAERSGTGFFRHRESGLTRMPSIEDLREQPEFFEKLKRQMVEGNENDWELMDFVRGTYNKAVVFDAPLFHSRYPKNGFGSTAEDGRIIWATHFRMIDTNGALTQ